MMDLCSVYAVAALRSEFRDGSPEAVNRSPEAVNRSLETFHDE